MHQALDEQHLAIQKGRIRMPGGWFDKRSLSLLSYLANELVNRARAGPLTSAQYLVKLVSRCYMGDGRYKTSSREQVAERVEDALAKGNCRRALGLLSQRVLLSPGSQGAQG